MQDNLPVRMNFCKTPYTGWPIVRVMIIKSTYAMSTVSLLMEHHVYHSSYVCWNSQNLGNIHLNLRKTYSKYAEAPVSELSFQLFTERQPVSIGRVDLDTID